MKDYLITKDIAGYNGFGLEFPEAAYSAVLATTTDTALIVPSTVTALGNSYSTTNARMIAIITGDPNAVIWFNLNNTAAPASGAAFSAVTSVLLNMRFPVGYVVKAGDTLHFYTAGSSTNEVSVAFYRIAS